MYRQFFGLKEKPFTISPNPRYLYMSPRHREALAHLLFGIGDGGGFVVLTGEVGTGKTTLCRRMLEQMPSHINVAYVVNPKISAQELLEIICNKLNIPVPPQRRNIKELIDLLNHFLLETHKRGMKTVLVIDEAQNLTTDVLEQIRLLTNLETDEEKLLQIVLVGQPELQEALQRNELRQLTQRITARFHLTALNASEVSDYLKYRLHIAGCDRPLFSPAAEKSIYRFSGGVPRVINLLADRALLGAYARNQSTVSAALVKQAARELLIIQPSQSIDWFHGRLKWGVLAAMAVTTLGLGIVLHMYGGQDAPREIKPALSSTQVFSLDAALQVLSRIWGVSNVQACPGIHARLQCIQTTLDLDSLQQLGLPSVVTLTDGHSKKMRWAVVVGVDAQQVKLYDGAQYRALDLIEFQKRWTGEVRYLWEMPPGYNMPMRRGMRGTDVAWLKKRLMVWSGLPAEQLIVPEWSEYDAELEALVKKFQQSQHLRVDGVAGPLTLIRLAQLSDPDYPRLSNAEHLLRRIHVADL